MTEKSIPLVLLALIGISFVSARAQDVDVAVVVSAGNPVNNLTIGELRKIFDGQKRSWPGNIPIKLIVRAPGSHERVVLLKLLNMSETEYKQYWTAQVLRGEADAEPSVVPSVGMQKEAMLAFPGAISLVDAKDVKPGMKTIRIDGLSPGSPGYLLH
jgi:ABC-type phosphate transport system substrate-binding protein